MASAFEFVRIVQVLGEHAFDDTIASDAAYHTTLCVLSRWWI